MLQLNRQELQSLKELVETNYYKAIYNKQVQIKDFYLSLYGFIPYWYQKETTNVFIKIKEFMDYSNVKVEEIKEGIRKYLGYAACLFTIKDGKQIPIPLERIEKALLLIDSKAHKVQVENALYF